MTFLTEKISIALQQIDLLATTNKMKAIEARDHNPMGISVRPFGHAVAYSSIKMPGPSFNVVKGWTDEDRYLLGDILTHYKDLQIPVRFELSPATVTPATLSVIGSAGLQQTGFHTVLYMSGKMPKMDSFDNGSAFEIKEVIKDIDFSTYASIYTEGFSMPSYLTDEVMENNKCLDPSHWHLYIIYDKTVPAGVAAMYLNGVHAYLSAATIAKPYRNRGMHSYLIKHRLQAAIDHGCTLIVSQAAYNSTSMRNMLKSGMQIAYNSFTWG
ncbi:GNAT family N-acetyltransferase [Bacillus sp. 1P06AnD]|uniref:GNAT family N-acetyltransferase n=1 Tax=Bacillus sp. 1P06AnD TaxID=3132208 RepID=UPI0039A06A54